MLDLREYRTRRRELADYLPWAGLVAPGVVLNKDGALQRTARFRGPDLDASTPAELVAFSARVNNALKRLDAGWALFVEAARREAPGYPQSRFPDPVSWLVDEERRAGFEREGAHFEGEHFLTFCYLAPLERAERASKVLYDTAGERRGVDWREVLDAFRAETDRVLDLLATLMPECAWLDDAETLAYLHGTVSTHGRHPVAVPEAPFHLDGLLPDCDLTPGVAPMLGRCHLRTLTLRGMPSPTWPGLLDELNRLPIAHRWVARWLPLEKAEAQKEIARKRRHWWAKRKGIAALLREVVWQQETRLVDSDAENQSLDADAALQELGSDAVSFGHFTATVTVWDRDETAAEEKVKLVGRAARAQGFVAVDETLNAVEAWLSSLPGQCYANVRQPLVSSLNLVHMLPLSAVWAGPERNAHLDGPPLLVARTAGSTPFRLVLHQGDVGHTLVVGPTGAGKSVLLALIALQFRRYKGSRVVLFDKGRSSKAAVLGMGGAFHDLHLGDEGGGEAVAFQPLARVDDAAERAWAAEWLATLLVQEGVEVTPEIRGAVWSALGSLASAPRPERTLSGYTALLQSNRLKVALEPYTLAGPYGRLLDAERETVRDADVLAFETEELLGLKRATRAVLTYLFHRIEVRLDGRPTLIPVDEAWFALDGPGLRAEAARVAEDAAAQERLGAVLDPEPGRRHALAHRTRGDRELPQPHLPAQRPRGRAGEPRRLRAARAERAPGRDRRPRGAQARVLVPVRRRLPPVRAGPRRGRTRLLRREPGRGPQGHRPPRHRARRRRVRAGLAARARTRLGGGIGRATGRIPPQPRGGRMTAVRRTLLAGAALSALLLARPAAAQWAVIDAANLTRNIMTAARTLEEVNNQVTQIQQGVAMLENQARNLTSLPFSVLSQLQSSMGQLNGLMGQAQSLAYDVQRLEQQFQQLYPNYAGPVTQAGLLADARARWQASVSAFQHTMSVQSQIVSAIPTDQAQLSALVTQSQGSVGALQAIQSGNQLLALQSRQLSATQDLLAANARAQAAETIRQAEVEEAARAEWRRFYGNGVGYTPTQVTVFGGAPP